MRDYKFRGLTKEGKEVKGSLIQSKDCQKAYIGYAEYSNDGVSVIYYEEVLPATVGKAVRKKNQMSNSEVYLKYCLSCKRKHYMIVVRCPRCKKYDSPQPLLAAVRAVCCRVHICEACKEEIASRHITWRDNP